jgi:hypothetical protein
MILFHHIVQIFDLADGDRNPIFLVISPDHRRIGLAAIHRDRLGDPIPADSFLQKPPRGLFVPVRSEKKVKGTGPARCWTA